MLHFQMNAFVHLDCVFVLSESAELLWGYRRALFLDLFNFYLFLFQQYNDVSYHLYIDDLQLYCSFKLQLNSSKTETLIVASDSAIAAIKHRLDDLNCSVKDNQLVKKCLFQIRYISKLCKLVSSSLE